MRSHDHDVDPAEGLRPKATRLEASEVGHAATAASHGRWDAVGAEGFSALQRAVGNAAMGAALTDENAAEPERSPVHDVVASGGGRPLEPEVRADMEGRLGHDFGGVRVHDDARAHESATAVNAHAYTVGSNVVFQRGGYDPTSDAGRTTLAHELTHVVQQRQGPVDGTPTAGGISVSHPDDRFEREAAATAAAAIAAPATTMAPAAATATAGAAVQRDSEEEEEPVQTSALDASVQREGAEDEDLESPQ